MNGIIKIVQLYEIESEYIFYVTNNGNSSTLFALLLLGKPFSNYKINNRVCRSISAYYDCNYKLVRRTCFFSLISATYLFILEN